MGQRTEVARDRLVRDRFEACRRPARAAVHVHPGGTHALQKSGSKITESAMRNSWPRLGSNRPGQRAACKAATVILTEPDKLPAISKQPASLSKVA